MSRTRNLDALTGLRAVAALWVIAYHYATGPFRALGMHESLPIIRYGYLGVDLFFILSGFVIWHAHGNDFLRPTPRGFLRFLSLRGARLYPVHLATLAILAALLWIIPQSGDPALNPDNNTTRQFLLQLALVQTWGFTQHLTWNYPSWSVSAEWFCYIVFPLAAVLVSRAGRGGTLAAILAIFLMVLASYEIVFSERMNQVVGVPALLRATPEFVLGLLLRKLLDHYDISAWPWGRLVAGFGLAWALSFWTALPMAIFGIAFFAALILAGTVRSGIVARVLCWRPFLVIGAASYSLYLSQAPVQKLAHAVTPEVAIGHPMTSAAIILAYVGTLAAITAAMHGLVENPSRRWLRGWIDRAFATSMTSPMTLAPIAIRSR